jgi:hypothetical protein
MLGYEYNVQPYFLQEFMTPSRAAAIENPRLMIALIAVIDAQKINGTVILKSYDVRDQTTSKEDE